MHKLLRGLLFSTVLALTTGFFTVDGVRNAHAVPAEINLGFVMDRSGSVADADYTAAMNALAAAINANIPTGDPNFVYTIAVVSFSSSGTLNVAATTVNSPATLAAVVGGITAAAGTPTSGGTNFQAGFDTLRATFGIIGGEIGIINMLTDGNPNGGNTAAGIAALKADGWDSLSFEAVNNFNNNPDEALLAGLGFDTTDDAATIIGNAGLITNPLSNAFVLAIGNFNTDYTAAVNAKLQAIVNPIPLPGALPLFAAGLGLMGFMGWRRKRMAAA